MWHSTSKVVILDLPERRSPVQDSSPARRSSVICPENCRPLTHRRSRIILSQQVLLQHHRFSDRLAEPLAVMKSLGFDHGLGAELSWNL